MFPPVDTPPTGGRTCRGGSRWWSNLYAVSSAQLQVSAARVAAWSSVIAVWTGMLAHSGLNSHRGSVHILPSCCRRRVTVQTVTTCFTGLVKEKCDPCSRNALLIKRASCLANQAYCPAIFWFFSPHFLCFYETLAKVGEGGSSKVHVDCRASSKDFLSFQTLLITILLLMKLRDEMLFWNIFQN